jgi:hypothetical protein
MTEREENMRREAKAKQYKSFTHTAHEVPLMNRSTRRTNACSPSLTSYTQRIRVLAVTPLFSLAILYAHDYWAANGRHLVSESDDKDMALRNIINGPSKNTK